MMKKLCLALATVALLFSSHANARVSCKSFATQAEAQAYFKANHAKSLDRDNDGIACENLAGGKKSQASKKSVKKSGKKKR